MTIFENDPPKISSVNEISDIENKSLEAYLSGINTSYDILKIASKLYQNKTAISYISDLDQLDIVESFDYIELFEHVNRVARLFIKHQIGQSDVIAIILPNLPITQIGISAAEAVAIANPINPGMSNQEILRLLKLTNAKYLLTVYDIWNRLYQDGVIDDDMTVFICDHHKVRQPQLIYLDESLMLSSDVLSDRDVKKSNDICAIYHTSGTTDSPKLVTLTHFGKVYNAWATVAMSHYSYSDVIFSAMPYFHVGAPTVTGNSAFSVGAEVVLIGASGWMEPKAVANFWSIVSLLKITRVIALAQIYREILRLPLLVNKATSLTHAISGTALSSESYEKFKSITQVCVQEIYGLTECGCIASSTIINDETHQGTMGVPYPFMKMRVHKLDDRRIVCVANESGELCIKGPSVTSSFIPATDNPNYFMTDHWLKTGDVVYQDQLGYFHYCYRLSHTSASDCSERATLHLIENILLNIPEVKQAAVTAARGGESDEKATAYVSFFEGVEITAQDIISIVKSKLGEESFIPIHIKILAHLPVNGMGKVVKIDSVSIDS